MTIEGPEELTLDFDARFTCKASAYNLPTKMTFKLTSHNSDVLEKLINSELVVIEETKEKWVEGGSDQNGAISGWVSSRTLIMKSQLLEKAQELGEQITFECQVPDPYHERRILVSASKFVSLFSKFLTNQIIKKKSRDLKDGFDWCALEKP